MRSSPASTRTTSPSRRTWAGWSRLDADTRLGLVGSAVTLIDEADGELGVRPMPESDLEIRWTILFHNPFFHSAVAFRRELFDEVGGYRDDELISRTTTCGTPCWE